ncbi:hypothetical protein FRUB_08062 [Fimbriiglobus ruber]|uniref:Uncharacterized protein n=1 Tax=Fimbriiglobus ruber TaxID=1908690 RepID=A0A225DEC5_9BACT|nr:hypothetical protein FRUB_08062 [Fimbriiglobus ruber]
MRSVSDTWDAASSGGRNSIKGHRGRGVVTPISRNPYVRLRQIFSGLMAGAINTGRFGTASTGWDKAAIWYSMQ